MNTILDKIRLRIYAVDFLVWVGKNNWKCISNNGMVWEQPIDSWYPEQGKITKTSAELFYDYMKEKTNVNQTKS